MISFAKQDGDIVAVFDERGQQVFWKVGELLGYTANTVTIKDGSYIHVYNEQGREQFSKHV